MRDPQQQPKRSAEGGVRWAGVAALLLGCGPGAKGPTAEGPAEGALMRADAWAPIPPEDDPWPGGAGCSAEATRLEGDVLELDTGLCAHISVQQVILGEVREGERLALLAWHAPLTLSSGPAEGADTSGAEESGGAEGWMVLTLDGQPLWELRRPIPSGPTVEAREDILGIAAPEGALLRLHVENHGANTWNFAWLQRAD